MNANEITLEMLNEKYQKTCVDDFKEYVEMVSAFIGSKEFPYKYNDEEHHDLVALGNDYVFQDWTVRQKLMDKVRNVPYEELYNVFQECGLTTKECHMIFSRIYETCFLNCLTHGEGNLYEVLHFPVVSVVLHWDKGLFYTTKF